MESSVPIRHVWKALREAAMWRTLSLLLVLLLVVPALSQSPETFRVKLHVSADAQMQARVENCLARELQRLGNIQITAEAHHWLLHILVIDLMPTKGYVLSMVILENTTIELNHQAVYIPDLHAAYIDPDLNALCARAVAAFNSSSLTPARAAHRTQRR
jgi:hypothetical protein